LEGQGNKNKRKPTDKRLSYGNGRQKTLKRQVAQVPGEKLNRPGRRSDHGQRQKKSPNIRKRKIHKLNTIRMEGERSPRKQQGPNTGEGRQQLAL